MGSTLSSATNGTGTHGEPTGRRAKNVAVVGLDGAGKSCLLARFFCSRKFDKVDVTPPYLTQNVAHVVRALAAGGSASRSAGFATKLSTVILPTCGFSCMDMVETSGSRWRVWDMSGQGRYRHFWDEYCAGADAIVFVHACNDVERIEAMNAEFHAVMRAVDSGARGGEPTPFLFVLAKSDVVSAGRSSVASKGAGAVEDDAADDGEDEVPPEGQITPVQLADVLELDEIDPVLHASHIQVMSAINGDGVAEGFKWLSSTLDKIQNH